MYLCICKSVSDHQIRQAVSEGARSFGDLSIRLGVGVECGKCVESINEVLRECLAAPVAPADAAPAPPSQVAEPVSPQPASHPPAPAHAWFAVDL